MAWETHWTRGQSPLASNSRHIMASMASKVDFCLLLQRARCHMPGWSAIEVHSGPRVHSGQCTLGQRERRRHAGVCIQPGGDPLWLHTSI